MSIRQKSISFAKKEGNPRQKGTLFWGKSSFRKPKFKRQIYFYSLSERKWQQCQLILTHRNSFNLCYLISVGDSVHFTSNCFWNWNLIVEEISRFKVLIAIYKVGIYAQQIIRKVLFIFMQSDWDWWERERESGERKHTIAFLPTKKHSFSSYEKAHVKHYIGSY